MNHVCRCALFLALIVLSITCTAQTAMEEIQEIPQLSSFTWLLSNITRFLDEDEASVLQNIFQNTPGVSILAPSDEAFGKLSFTQTQDLLSSPSLLLSVLRMHILPEKFEIPEDADTDLILLLSVSEEPVLYSHQTEYGRESSFATALSSAVVQTSNIEADNDVIIHIVDDFLIPLEIKQILEDYSGEEFMQLIADSDIIADSDDSDSMWTFFVPSADLIDATNMSTPDLQALLEYYIVPLPVLLEGDDSSFEIENLLGSDLEVTQEDGAFAVDGNLISEPNVVSGNLILHFLDSSFETNDPSEQTIIEAMSGIREMTGLVDLIQNSPAFEGILTTLSDPDATVTFFAPLTIPEVSEDELATIIADGIIDAPLDLSDILEGALFTSSETGAPLVIGVFDENSDAPSVVFGIPGNSEYSSDIIGSEELANGYLYLIDAPVEERSSFSEIVENAPVDIESITSIIGIAEASGELDDLREENFPVTLFLPSDQAFADSGIDFEDFSIEEMGEIARSYIFPETALFSSGIEDTAPFTVTALSGEDFGFSVDENGMLQVNGVEVGLGNMIFDGGVIHTLDDMIPA